MSQVVAQSPYGREASNYIETGIACLPVGPGTKVPGSYDGQRGWHNMHDWPKYAVEMPTEIQIDIWSNDWPDAGICVPMGGANGLLGIDIDTDRRDIVDALERELDGLLIARRRGKRGYCAFVRVPEGFVLKQTKWNVDGLRVLDLLWTGRQVVMPPTIHPDTQKAYEWLSPFKAYDLDEMPPCPDDIVERCRRAIEPFQNADDKRKQTDELTRAEYVVNESDNIGRQINDAALHSVSTWINDLCPAEMIDYSKWTKQYRIKPFWRGVTDAAKVSISVDGIRDFAENKGYTPIDLVMVVRGCEVGEAMEWLGGKLGIVVREKAVVEPGSWFDATADDVRAEQAEREAARAHTAMMVGTSVPVVVVVDDGVTPMKPIAKASAVVEAGIPNELLTPPGRLSDILRWILATATQPLPEMSLHAALAFGSMVARQIYIGPTGVRSNLNLIGIARSGYGKNHPQSCVRKLMFESGESHVLGGARLSSGQSIITRLSKKTSGCAALYVFDEVDGMLKAALNPNGAPHLRDIAEQFMTLYSMSGEAAVGTTDYANDDKNPTKELSYPHLALLGYTTPDRFWDCVKGKDVSSGFVNRLMVAQAPEERLNERADDEVLRLPVPAGVIAWVRAVREARYAAETGALALGATASAPVQVQYGGARAKSILAGFKIEVEEQRQNYRREGLRIDEALVRWYENAQKLALIAAVAKSDGMGPPVLDEECAAWAVGYVRWCGRLVVAGVKDQVFESDFDEWVQKTRQFILQKGERGITPGRLSADCQSIKKLEPAKAKSVMDRLVQRGSIEMREVTRENGRKSQVWVAVDSLGDDD
jgi:hypothetical protein